MKNKGFGHLKTRLFTIKTSKHVALGGPWYILIDMEFTIWNYRTPFSLVIEPNRAKQRTNGLYI